MKGMLDTDTCIAINKKHPVALKKLGGKSIGQLGLSSITPGKFACGTANSSRPKEAYDALHEFLLALEIAAFDDLAAIRAQSIDSPQPDTEGAYHQLPLAAFK